MEQLSGDLTEEALRDALPPGSRFGRVLEIRRAVESTNDLAKRRADDGAPEGTAVLADQQTAGRGRQGRAWYSPPGRNLYLSVVLRPPVAPPEAPPLTLVAAVALAEALGGLPGISPDLKWPNDLYLGGRKAAGILTEMTSRDDQVLWAVVGIGLNVNLGPEDLPAELRDVATSLHLVSGRQHPRAPIAAAILGGLERWTARFYAEGAGPVLRQWERTSTMIGRPIRLREQDGVLEGTASGLDERGALLVSTSSGERLRVLAGDIELG